jgi:hypothetical protein
MLFDAGAHKLPCIFRLLSIFPFARRLVAAGYSKSLFDYFVYKHTEYF